MYAEKKPQRGKLRRIFGKVAAVVSLAATFAFYALGFNIGHAYFNEWQANKAETSVTQTYNETAPRQDYTANLPWAAAGTALALSYGAGFAGIALGKRKDDDGYSYSSYGGSSSGSSDNFWLGYVLGSNNGGSSRSSSGSSKDNGGAAAALVIVGAVALAAGASVVSYKAVKGNFFTGEPPIIDKKPDTLEEISRQPVRSLIEETPAKVEPEPVAVAPPVPPPVTPTMTNDAPPPEMDKELVKRWKPLSI